MIIRFLFLVITLCFISCKSSKLLRENNAITRLSTEELISKVYKNLPNIEWLDGRASASITINHQSRKFSTQIRLKKDSLFMANGKKLSQELGRILISQDSFHLRNKVNKTYESKSFISVANAYNIPLSFEQLMNMILGMPIDSLKVDLFESKSEPSSYLLYGYHDELKAEYRIDRKSFDILEIKVKDLKSGLSSHVTYHDFSDNEENLARLRTFTFDNGRGEEIVLRVNFTKINLNVPGAFKFNIPKDYTKID